MTKVGGSEEVLTSKLYDIPLLNINGKKWYIRAYGIDKISSNISRMNVNNVISLFGGVMVNDITQPEGEVDLLIGYDYAGLHPVKQQAVDNLILLCSEFGKCIAGTHPKN